jgi:transcriptional regulator with GAF, ATPase, and Fis domain
LSDSELARTLSLLADSAAPHVDVADSLQLLTTWAAELWDVDATHVLLVDNDGDPQLASASTEPARLVGLAQIHYGEGPSLEALRQRTVSTWVDVVEDPDRWPRFAEAARLAGYAGVQGLPLRHDMETIGAVSLLRTTPGQLAGRDLVTAQVLTELAAIGTMNELGVRRRDEVTRHLQIALNSRITIEQAKGMLAARRQCRIDDAFETLRCYARNNNMRLHDLACAVVSGGPEFARLLEVETPTRGTVG